MNYLLTFTPDSGLDNIAIKICALSMSFLLLKMFSFPTMRFKISMIRLALNDIKMKLYYVLYNKEITRDNKQNN